MVEPEAIVASNAPLFPESGLQASDSRTAREVTAAALALNTKSPSELPQSDPMPSTSTFSDRDCAIHLLLSGGGYRATLYHLGILRYLYEHQWEGRSKSLLAEVNYVIGVSGGSITATHFAMFANEYNALFTTRAMELIKFTTAVDLRRQLLVHHEPVANSLLGLFPADFNFAGLPNTIALRILATDLNSGGCVAFGNDNVRLYSNTGTNQSSLQLRENVKRDDLQLRYAVAASSAFPPFFPPLYFTKELFPAGTKVYELEGLLEHLIADGGIRDNLGIEFYLMDAPKTPTPRMRVVSDAGLEFDWDPSASNQVQTLASWGARALRTIDIQMKRLADLDLGTLADKRHVSLKESVSLKDQEDSGQKAFNQPLTRSVAQKIAETPTDLCCPEPAEAYAIVRLGYDLAKNMLQGQQGLERRSHIPDPDFWKALLPRTITSLNSVDDKTSLLNAVRGKETPRVQNADDLAGQTPITPSQQRLMLVAYSAYKHPWIWGAALLLLFSLVQLAIFFGLRGLVIGQSPDNTQLKKYVAEILSRIKFLDKCLETGTAPDYVLGGFTGQGEDSGFLRKEFKGHTLPGILEELRLLVENDASLTPKVKQLIELQSELFDGKTVREKCGQELPIGEMRKCVRESYIEPFCRIAESIR